MLLTCMNVFFLTSDVFVDIRRLGGGGGGGERKREGNTLLYTQG